MTRTYTIAETPWIDSDDDCWKLPTFLDRSKWSDKDRERFRQAGIKADEIERQRRRQKDRMIFLRTKRERHRRILHEYRRDERKIAKMERRGRRVQRDRIHEEHNGQVIGALRQGDETAGQVSKRTGLLTKEARRSLKRLIRRGRVAKLSGRRYRLIVRKRKRLSDVL